MPCWDGFLLTSNAVISAHRATWSRSFGDGGAQCSGPDASKVTCLPNSHPGGGAGSWQGGLNIQMERLRSVGLRAFAIAVTGTLLPVLMGWGLMTALDMGGLEGVAAGTVLSRFVTRERNWCCRHAHRPLTGTNAPHALQHIHRDGDQDAPAARTAAKPYRFTHCGGCDGGRRFIAGDSRGFAECTLSRLE